MNFGSRLPTAQKLVIRFPHNDQKDATQDYEQSEVLDGDNSTTGFYHDYALTFTIPELYIRLLGGADSKM